MKENHVYKKFSSMSEEEREKKAFSIAFIPLAPTWRVHITIIRFNFIWNSLIHRIELEYKSFY